MAFSGSLKRKHSSTNSAPPKHGKLDPTLSAPFTKATKLGLWTQLQAAESQLKGTEDELLATTAKLQEKEAQLAALTRRLHCVTSCSPLMSARQAKIWLMLVRTTIHPNLFVVVAREVCKYISDPILCYVNFNTVLLVDAHTCKTTARLPLERPLLKNCYEEWSLLVNSDQLFRFGESISSRRSEAVLITGKGHYCEVSSMPIPAKSHRDAGRFAHKDTLYLFGGETYTGNRIFERPQKTTRRSHRCIEVLNLACPIDWKPLAVRMPTERSKFTPCLWNFKIWLCGGAECPAQNIIDVYDVAKQCFEESRHVALPKEPSLAAAVVGDQLILMMRRFTARIDLASAPLQVEKEANELGFNDATSVPVICGKFLFWTTYQKCICVTYAQRPVGYFSAFIER